MMNAQFEFVSNQNLFSQDFGVIAVGQNLLTMQVDVRLLIESECLLFDDFALYIKTRQGEP